MYCKNLSFLSLAVSLFAILVCFGLSTVVAQNSPDESRITVEKDDKAELRVKACGTESVNYKASTDKGDKPMPAAPADKAMVYVMRTSMLGYKIHSKFAVNGEWVGVNRGKTYFFLTLNPGEHYMCSEAENQSYLAVTLEPGKSYYLQQQVQMGVWKARTKLVLMDEEEGKKKLSDLNLSVFSRKD